jgi:hypothetical protein
MAAWPILLFHPDKHPSGVIASLQRALNCRSAEHQPLRQGMQVEVELERLCVAALIKRSEQSLFAFKGGSDW